MIDRDFRIRIRSMHGISFGYVNVIHLLLNGRVCFPRLNDVFLNSGYSNRHYFRLHATLLTIHS